jgi:hypothetical protein
MINKNYLINFIIKLLLIYLNPKCIIFDKHGISIGTFNYLELF